MGKLLAISELIELAKLRGIDFGPGNPRTHLAYLTEIGLLPPAIRRKSAQGGLEGHYTDETLGTLEKIETLKKQGLSYADITKRLGASDERLKKTFSPTYSASPLPLTASPYIFLIIGLLLGFLLGKGDFNTPGVSQATVTDSKAGGLTAIVVPQEAITPSGGSYLISLPDDNLKVKNLYKIEGIQIK